MPVRPGLYTVPAIGRFGAWRVHGRHRGVDQYAPQGTEIVLAAEAIVLSKGNGPDEDLGFGHWVRYRHSHDGHIVLEAHMTGPSPLAVGGRYPAGRLVGRVGRSGNAVRVGPHDHVEVRRPSGMLIDPELYLAPLWAPPAPTQIGVDDMRLIRRTGTASPEWSLFHPSLAGADEKQRGYITTADPETARGWARTWGDGFGTEKGEPRDVYVEMQAAARLTHEAYLRSVPASSSGGIVEGTFTARPA